MLAMSDAKMDPESSCPEFDDLSPDSRMECQEYVLDREIAALQKKREILKIKQSDPMER